MGSKPSKSATKARTISAHERSSFNAAVTKYSSSGYFLLLETTGTVSTSDFTSCFKLVELTSANAYRASSKGWSPRDKQSEMREPTMRYILVRGKDDVDSHQRHGAEEIAGFLSYMLTEEDGYDVIYIYEIHVSPILQGQGIGASLLQVVEVIGGAMRMEKAMLTVFTNNEAALRLYKRQGYEKWDEEPVVKKRLRSGSKGRKPTYVILGKDLNHKTDD